MLREAVDVVFDAGVRLDFAFDEGGDALCKTAMFGSEEGKLIDQIIHYLNFASRPSTKASYASRKSGCFMQIAWTCASHSRAVSRSMSSSRFSISFVFASPNAGPRAM